MADDQIRVDIVADYDDRDARKAKTDLEAIDGTTAEAEVAVDDNASKVTGAVESDLRAIDGTTAEAEVSVDDNASKVTGAVESDLEAIDGTTAEAEVSVDDNASKVTGAVAADLEAIDGDTARAAVEVTGDPTAGAVAADLRAIDGATPKADITVTGDPTAANVAGDLREIDGKTAKATIDADATAGTNTLISRVGGLPGAVAAIGPELRTMAATGGPIAAVAAAFIGAATEASNVALEAEGIADFAGTSVENASALQAVLRDTDAMEANDLKDTINQVTGALASNPALIETLGLKMDTVRQGPFETFIAAVDAWNSGQLSANEKMTVGSQLFGEEGIRQISALTSALDTDLATAIANVSENRIISEADVEAAREVKRQFAELSGQLQGMAVQVGGEVVPVLADMLGMVEDTVDGVNNIFELGQTATPLSVFDWIEQFPSAQFVEIYDALNKAGVSAEDLRNDFFDLNDVMALLEAGVPAEVIQGAELTADAQEHLSREIANTADAAGDETTALDTLAAEQQAANEQAAEAIAVLQDQAEAHREAAEASGEQADALLSANEVFYAQQEALRGVGEAVANYDETVADATATDSDRIAALQDVAKAADELAQTEVDAARQTRATEGATLSYTEALDIQNRSLINQAGQMEGPTRQALVNHIARLNNIPPEVVSDILALIDQGKIDEAEQLLADTSRTRTATVKADNDDQALRNTESELEWLSRDRDAWIRVHQQAVSGFGAMFGAGVGMAPSMAPAVAAPAAAGGDTYNLNLPRGTRVTDTVRALDRHARRNGRRPYAFR
jgi:hypothetical protein